MSIPLEQGLRLSFSHRGGRRAEFYEHSIRTRIKTDTIAVLKGKKLIL